MNKTPRILILSAGSGQGHNRAAEALEKAARSIVPEGEIKMLDSLEYTTDIFQTIYSTYYIEAVKNAPTLWGWGYEWTDVPWKNQQLREWFERINAQPLVKEIIDFNPDFIINTHFVPAAITSSLILRGRLEVHNSVVITDFYAHASWLVRAFHRYFVAHGEERHQLASYGIPADRISVTGIPIDPVFAEPKNSADMKTYFGLDPHIPLILLAAGAYGVVPVDTILRPLLQIEQRCQIVVMCGRNEKLEEKIRDFIDGCTQENPLFRVIGYTDEMQNWMAAADLFITKPGGLTSAESLACALPMILTNPIPGQEVYNAMYLLEHGAAVIPTSPATVGYKVNKFLTQPLMMEKYSTTAGKLGHPDAARRIVEMVLEKAEEEIVRVKE